MIQAIRDIFRATSPAMTTNITASAFGDNFSAWGTPVILIETGALQGKPEMFLVKMNFIAIATALKSLADGSEKNISPDAYEQLPHNTSGRVFSFVFRNAVGHRPGKAERDGDRRHRRPITARRRAEFTAPTVVGTHRRPFGAGRTAGI